MSSHEVRNQPPPLEGHDVYGTDVALVEAVEREGAGWAAPQLHRLGCLAGSAEAITWGFEANASPPVLRTHDRFGHRIDRVDHHPSYHRLMTVAVGYGLHAAPWSAPRAGGHVARAAGFAVWSQVDAGHGCPISMTYSVVPALGAAPALLAEWQPRLASTTYDPSFGPVRAKHGALAGMAMTEKQGGSDLRANMTVAVRVGSDDTYSLTGHKWFCSAPMSDLFLVLAQAPGGLTCFVVPRWRPDGEPNAIALQRLKDKLGNRSNASSEIELDGALGWMLGEEGRGVPTIIEMVTHTRLDCVIGSASGMRQAVAQATHHAAHRHAFGARLADQPLMGAVLADLAVESEAATLTMARLAGAYDRAAGDEHERALRRLATAVAKYWICKRQPVVVAEALECLGGNGYVEESILPRLFRESPLNGIWEGSGNVLCLDVLRTLARQPESAAAFLAELERGRGGDRRLDRAIDALRAVLAPGIAPDQARRVVESMALALQGSLVVRFAPAEVADVFCATRLGGEGGRALGTLPPRAPSARIVARATPVPH